MKQYLIAYLTSALALSLLESLWLRVVVPFFYQSQIREAIRPETSLTIAGAFYGLMLAGMLLFGRQSSRRPVQSIIALIVITSVGAALYAAGEHTGLAELFYVPQPVLYVLLSSAIAGLLALAAATVWRQGGRIEAMLHSLTDAQMPWSACPSAA